MTHRQSSTPFRNPGTTIPPQTRHPIRDSKRQRIKDGQRIREGQIRRGSLPPYPDELEDEVGDPEEQSDSKRELI